MLQDYRNERHGPTIVVLQTGFRVDTLQSEMYDLHE